MKPSFDDELVIYNAISSMSVKAFEVGTRVFIKGLQEELKKHLGAAGVQPNGTVASLATAAGLSANQASVLQKYDSEILLKVFRKMTDTIDMSFQVRPRVEKTLESITYLAEPGDIVPLPSPEGPMFNPLATHEFEINLGVFRCKGIW